VDGPETILNKLSSLKIYSCFRHGKKTQTGVDGIFSRERINESLFAKSLLLSSNYLPGWNTVMDLASPVCDWWALSAKDLKMSAANAH
jgi:hypothetical protein